MKYFALLTEIGENLLAQATALGTKLELTQMAVGDGNGQLPTPDPKQTKLVAEKRRGAINTLFVDEKNKNQIVAEQIIPEKDGGWWIREIGLFDKSDNLIAVANCPETYKPQLSEGSGRTQTVRIILIVSHTESVALKIDPSVVLATREYVDKAIQVQDKKIKDIVVQETGDNTDKVMSQKACTDILAKKNSEEALYAGGIIIKYGNPTLKFQTTYDNSYAIFELDTDKKALKIDNRNSDDTLKNSVTFPTESGTLALTSSTEPFQAGKITAAGNYATLTLIRSSDSSHIDIEYSPDGKMLSIIFRTADNKNSGMAQITPDGNIIGDIWRI